MPRLRLKRRPVYFRYSRPLKRGQKTLIRLAAVFIAAVILVFLTGRAIRPTLAELALNTATDLVTYAVNETVEEKMDDGSLNYSSLVTLEKNSSGEITALVTNMSKINSVQAGIVNDVIEKLSDMDRTTVYIPLGSIIGGSIFSGSGPELRARIVSVSSVNAEFSNEFSDAGINQTRHRIMLEVSVVVGVMVPGYELDDETVSVEVCIAETVIVGDVPDNYAYLG